MANPNALISEADLQGWLYIFVAFDWGDEVNLDQAGRLAPGALLDLPPRPRTPTSIAYKRRPLHFSLDTQRCDLPQVDLLSTQGAQVTVFDFGGVSVNFRPGSRRLAKVCLHWPVSLLKRKSGGP
jgi:hypothetical protein